MDEKKLIEGCKKQDRKCQNALYKKYFPLLTSIALRYYENKDEALAGLNFGFLKVLQNMDKYDDTFAFATWVRRILVNHFIDEFRKNNQYVSSIHLSSFEEYDEPVEYGEMDAYMEEEELRFMLQSLPKVTAKVFNMYAIDGYKHKEIAELLKISDGTSKWHVSEARKRLKAQIESKFQAKKKDNLTASAK